MLALGIATVCGLGSSFIGGQIGFILGYLSALVPVILVGIGSIAPALIGDSLTHLLTHSLTYSLTHLLTHAL